MMLNEKDAYLAMFSFLENLYKRTKSDDLGGLLGGMSLLEDGSPADPAMWNDWLASLERLQNGEVDASLRLDRL
ncbi:MAG: hypothetical protein AAFX78_16305 [Cyanobacteria bacterium J06638_20]